MLHAETYSASTSASSVRELVESAISGDGAAFSELCCRNTPFVRSIILRMLGRVDLVDEVLQETFIIAWRKLRALRDPAAFRAWLGKIASNTALNSVRKNQFERRTIPGGELDLTIFSDGTNDPLTELIEDEFFDRHRGILAQMRPNDRAILSARIHDGLTMEELASTFDVALGTAKRRLHTARSRYMALN